MTAAITHAPWWWEAAPPDAPAARDIAPVCDVAVIGAGYTGLTAALTLAKAGKSVQVFEKDRPGEGASTRNGGITSGSLRIGLSAAIRAFGQDRGAGLHREAIKARQFLRTLIKENGIDCDYALTGLFTGALTEADFQGQKREVDAANTMLGTDHTIIGPAELGAYAGSARYVGGVLNKDVGTIHPAKLVSGLLAAAQHEGAEVHGQTPVSAVTPAPEGHRLDTPRGACVAGEVIVATNGYTDASNPWLARRLVPVNSRIVVTEELPSNLITALMPDGRAMGEVRKLYHYFRPTPDGKRILMGSREPAGQPSAEVAINHVYQGMTAIFPQLGDYAITHSWAGKVAFNRNNLPLMFHANGLHHAVGYCGSGTVWAPWLGYKTALKILGDPEAHSLFDVDPPKAVPLYTGKPWFLPAVINSYRFIDWMKGRS